MEKLTGEGVVINVSGKALKDTDYQIGVDDIEGWEKTNGKLPDDIILLFKTGYGSFYPDPKIIWERKKKVLMQLLNVISPAFILMLQNGWLRTER